MNCGVSQLRNFIAINKKLTKLLIRLAKTGILLIKNFNDK